MKHNPEQIEQNQALELGRIWIALLAIRKGVRVGEKSCGNSQPNIIAGFMINSYILPTSGPPDSDRIWRNVSKSRLKGNFGSYIQ